MPSTTLKWTGILFDSLRQAIRQRKQMPGITELTAQSSTSPLIMIPFPTTILSSPTTSPETVADPISRRSGAPDTPSVFTQSLSWVCGLHPQGDMKQNICTRRVGRVFPLTQMDRGVLVARANWTRSRSSNDQTSQGASG